MDMMGIIWLSIIVIFVIVEALTVQLLCIWFAAGALIALIVAMLGAPEWVQITVFVICTALLLILTRPIAKRLMQRPREFTNADRVIGATAVVIHEINNDSAEGQVKVLNQIWTARSLSGEILPVDAKVVVHSIEGVKVIVAKYE